MKENVSSPVEIFLSQQYQFHKWKLELLCFNIVFETCYFIAWSVHILFLIN